MRRLSILSEIPKAWGKRPMKQAMLVTDVTRMQPPWVCVAGYLRDYTLVRPKLLNERGLTENFLFFGNIPIIKPFAVVELDFLKQDPHPPHTEDWYIDPAYKALKQERLPEERILAFLNRILDSDVASIFGAEIHREPGYYVKAGQGTRSLGTIQPKEIIAFLYTPKRDGWDYRLCFTDQSGAYYRLAITDLSFRYYCDYLRRQGHRPEEISLGLMRRWRESLIFLRIGLARGWERHPDRCYLQVTGIYTFPDYLEGRCFADFEVEPISPGATRKEEFEIPF